MIDDRFLPRVWTDKGYYYPIFSELGITYENKNLPFTEENIKDINWAFRWWFNHSKENVDMEYINTLEQCTGLKDKNGKLIYEGDIVKKEFKNKPFSSKAKTKEKLIKFQWNDNEACFSFDFLNEKDKHDNFQCWESGWKDKYSDDEIIGNIHENTDLLEEQE